MKTQSYFLFIMLVFTFFITGAALAQTHFSPPPGNPFSPMSIYFIGASIGDENMPDGDEIGVFGALDTNFCVGAKIISGEVSPLNLLEVIATMNDGIEDSANGFTEGDSIIFKFWDKSAQKEFTLKPEEVQFCDPQTGTSIYPVPFSGFGTAAVSITVVSSVSTPSGQEVIPQGYILHQNYPNPFNPRTRISYALLHSSQIELEIYNLRGDVVKTLYNGNQTMGHHFVEWDGTNNLGEKVATGIYFYKLTANNFVETKKMIYSR